MSTTTTRLSLVKPAASDRVNVTSHISNNFSTLDTRINAFVCTSATHPATPYEGMLIYETDTNLIKVYTLAPIMNPSSPDWLAIGNNSWSKGYKGQSTITANSANTSGTTELDTGIEVQFTAEADRRYMVELNTYGFMSTDDATAGGALGVLYRWASGAGVTTAGTELNTRDFITITTNNLERQIHGWRQWIPAVSGTVTVGIFLVGAASHVFRLNGNATNNRGTLTVRDIGV